MWRRSLLDLHMHSLPIQYRTALDVDVPHVVALVESAYRGESGQRGWTTESHLLDGQRTDVQSVSELIGRDGSIVLLAEREGELLACCHIEHQNGAGYFGMFAVNPDLQMGGIGRALLAEAERVAHQSWQVPTMRMTVIEQRAELIAWYERRGYALTGETLPFPYDDERCGLPRRDDLRFVCMSKPLGEVFA
jgi:ribosomal protein S18 acetylase RimI-like enzyme